MKDLIKCTIKGADIRLVELGRSSFVVVLCPIRMSSKRYLEECFERNLKRCVKGPSKKGMLLPNEFRKVDTASKYFFKLVKAANLKQIEFHEY